MGGEAGGDGDRATSTEVSHLGMRRTLPHLLHISNLAPEEGPRLLSQLPHAAPRSRGESCFEHLLRLAFFLRCLQGQGRRGTTWCGGTDLAWPASGWGGSKRSGWGWGTPCGGHGQSSAPGTVPPVRAVGSRVRAVPLRSPRKLDVSMGAAGAHGICGKRGCPASENSQLGRGRRGGSPRAGDLNFG